MKVIITGAGGYIGSVATYYFLQNNIEVIAIDNFKTGFNEPLLVLQEKFGKDKLRFYETNIAGDLNPILERESNIEALIHFAGDCSVNESMQDPQKYFQNNLCCSLQLLDSMFKYNIKNIVFSSTCAVYGETKSIPIDENHPTNPTNPYGQSKKMVEEIIQWYGKLIGLNYIILRYFNVCGASSDGLIGDSKKPSPHLVQNTVRAALGIEHFSLTCPEVDTPDKTPIRDYVNVVDLVQAHIKAYEYLIKKGISEIINLGTGKGNSVLEIINSVQNSTGAKFDIKRNNTRKGEYARMVASIKKAKKILNWEPKQTLQDSIASLITWYKQNPKGWKN